MLTKVGEIIKFGRKLYDKGLIAGFDGNISLRIDKSKILITASGVHKGLMDKNDILTVSISGQVIDGRGKPSSETALHLEIYSKTKAKAIIHAHSPFATAASLALKEIDLGSLTEGRLLFPNVAIVPELPPGTKDLAKAAANVAVKSKIFILKAHGVVSWGQNLLEAFGLIEALEHNIRILSYAKILKGP